MPRSYIAYEGQPNVTFNCIVDSGAAPYISWNVSIVSPPPERRNCPAPERQTCSTVSSPEGPTKESTIMIDATLEYNGTQIQCLAMSADDLTCAESSIVNRSTTVELLIQGKHFLMYCQKPTSHDNCACTSAQYALCGH